MAAWFFLLSPPTRVQNSPSHCSWWMGRSVTNAILDEEDAKETRTSPWILQKTWATGARQGKDFIKCRRGVSASRILSHAAQELKLKLQQKPYSHQPNPGELWKLEKVGLQGDTGAVPWYVAGSSALVKLCLRVWITTGPELTTL